MEKVRISCEKIERYLLADLKPHPRNYRTHPEDQIQHLMQSIQEHGLYRNVLIAREGTILAGHGVVEALSRMDVESIPVVRLDLDPNEPRALKILVGDNEIEHLGEKDDRMLSEMLKELNSVDLDGTGLLGTGFDEMMLANLAMVTRPASEISDFDAASEWVGMPEFEGGEETERLVVLFLRKEDRDDFVKEVGLTLQHRGKTYSAWWPPRERRDLSSLIVED